MQYMPARIYKCTGPFRHPTINLLGRAVPHMVARGSAAWVIAVLAVVLLLVGAMLLTVLDPVAQSVFASSLWTSSTSAGQMTQSAVENMWTYWSLFILLGLTSLVWIMTRRPG